MTLPWILRLWLRLTVPGEIRDDVVGDLEEAAASRARREGPGRARLRLWGQAFAAPFHVWRREPPLVGLFRGGLTQDLRFGLRRLARRPGVAATVVTVLALGIGGTTAVYSIFSPFVWPDLELSATTSLRGVATRPGEPGYFGPEELEALREALELPLAGSGRVAVTVRRGADAVRASGVAATVGHLEMLDAPLQLGRLPGEEAPGSPAPEVVVSHRFFESFLAGRASAVGTTLEIEGRPYVLVGVARSEFRGLSLLGAPDLWMPAELSGSGGGFVGRPLQVLVQAPGTMPDAALDARLAGAIPRVESDTLMVTSWVDVVIPRGERRALGQVGLLLALLGVVVLLAACANVANVLAAEGLSRHGEVAIRRAVGASRGRILRQLLVEAGVLATGALGVALGLAGWLLSAVPAWIPEATLAVAPEFPLSWQALGVAGGLALVAVLASALGPALSTSREASLLPGLRRVRKGEGSVAGDVLLVVQVAAAVVLLGSAGLLGRAISDVREADHGFRAEERWTFTVDLDPGGSGGPGTEIPPQAFLRELEGIPGVRSATLLSAPPIFTGGTVRRPEEEESAARNSGVVYAAEGYLETMGASLVAGGGLRPGQEGRVVLVSRDLARRLWPDGDRPVGRLLVVDGQEEPFRVVGVLAPGTYGLRQPRPMVVASLEPRPAGPLTAVVRAEPGVGGMAPLLRDRVGKLLPGSPRPEVVPVSDWFDRAWLVNRALAALARVFGVLALLIGLVGIYGRFRQVVARRRREVGIRIALGASKSSVVGRVLGRSAVLTGVGVVAGAGLTFAGARALGALLVGLPSSDPVVYAGVAGLVAVASFLATAGPALRAASVDPVEVLKEE